MNEPSIIHPFSCLQKNQLNSLIVSSTDLYTVEYGASLILHSSEGFQRHIEKAEISNGWLDLNFTLWQKLNPCGAKNTNSKKRKAKSNSEKPQTMKKRGKTQQMLTGLTLSKSSTTSQLLRFPLYHILDRGTKIELPRNSGIHLFNSLDQTGFEEKVSFVDTRSLGISMSSDVRFEGTLCKDKPPQQTAFDYSLKQLETSIYNCATMILPCGYGKTVLFINLCIALGRNSLILTNSTPLFNQAIERIRQFSPRASIGQVVQNKIEYENKDFVVAMVQTLVSRYEYFTQDGFFDYFGTLVVDEAHHVASSTYIQLLQRCSAKYRIGLTATPKRGDGCENALYHFCGPISFQAERVWEHVDVTSVVYTRGDQRELVYGKSKTSEKRVRYADMISKLVDDPIRHQLCLLLIYRSFIRGRYILVLCDRKKQATTLYQDYLFRCRDLYPNMQCSLLLGGMKKAQRDSALSKQVIFSTYHLFSEGVDVPRLDTLIFATPRSQIEQSLGRILRPHPEKQTPLVIDIVDPFSIFEGMRWIRHKYYKSQKYFVRTIIDNETCALSEETIVSIIQKQSGLMSKLLKLKRCPPPVVQKITFFMRKM